MTAKKGRFEIPKREIKMPDASEEEIQAMATRGVDPLANAPMDDGKRANYTAPPPITSPVPKHSIHADKDIKQGRYEFTQRLLKVPREVDDFIEMHKDPDAKHVSIYYKMMLIGMEVLKEQIEDGDVVIKF